MDVTARVSPEVAAEAELLVEIRRDLHRHPELSMEERRTAGVIRDRLRAWGVRDIREVIGTGTVAVIEGGRPGPTVVYRADMDGLPVQEENDVPYRSEVPGVMHACGHDGHVAIALGLAKLAQARREALPGRLVLVFQPAEESGHGAREMLAAGALEGLAPDAVFGLHIMGDLPLGRVGVEDGGQFAGVTKLEVVVRGRGGHAALPQQAVDPVVAAAHVVAALQTVVSRNVSPLQPAVVTIGTIQGGTRWNIIADAVTMTGTVRAYEDQLMERLEARVAEVARGVAAAFGAEAEVRFELVTPPVVNDAAMARFVRERAAALLGPENVVGGRTTGGDDVALFLRAAPGAYYVLGGRGDRAGKGGPHHSSRFDFDERCLPLGLELSWRVVRDFLEGRS
ncbi:MAG TPA: M20 family metallopeptidase [Dehalococcoidia bacterium]